MNGDDVVQFHFDLLYIAHHTEKSLCPRMGKSLMRLQGSWQVEDKDALPGHVLEKC